MDNNDWTIREEEIVKAFAFPDKATGQKFIREVRKIARRENRAVEIKVFKNKYINVHVPMLKEGNYSDQDVRILNLIDKLGC